MTSFYQFLIWFFTIVSLIALMYGVLSANLTFIGLFICTLIMSVIFYRLNETSPTNVTLESQVIDFALEGIDNDNIEVSEAIETLKREPQQSFQSFRKYRIIFLPCPPLLLLSSLKELTIVLPN